MRSICVGRKRVKMICGRKYSIKMIIIFSCVILGFLAFIFWLFFVVIAYRRPIYLYELVGKSCDRDNYELYYEKDGVRYYSACYDKVNVVEERFVFYYRYDVKKYIDEHRLLGILQKATINKWLYDDILQTDYFVDSYEDNDSVVITKCQVGGVTDYYFHSQQSNTFCKYFYQ